MSTLAGKTLVITGASRGIGLAVALRAAQDGANIAILAKTVEQDPRLPGTIHTAAKEIEERGGKALALKCDVRSEDDVKDAINKTAEHFGGIDVLVNNASAISLTPTEATEMKRFDLMSQVNGRATYMCSKFAIPFLKKSDNPHILNMSPPLNMSPRWFAPHLAYTMAKYNMSLCTLGMSAELKKAGIAVNSLWPETGIATAAVLNLLGGEEAMKKCRKPEIVADAAYWILTQKATEATGNFYVDSEVLRAAGVEDLSSYACDPNGELMRDFFLDQVKEEARK